MHANHIHRWPFRFFPLIFWDNHHIHTFQAFVVSTLITNSSYPHFFHFYAYFTHTFCIYFWPMVILLLIVLVFLLTYDMLKPVATNFWSQVPQILSKSRQSSSSQVWICMRPKFSLQLRPPSFRSVPYSRFLRRYQSTMTEVNKSAHPFDKSRLEALLNRRFFYAPAFEIYGGNVCSDSHWYEIDCSI